LKFKYLIIAFSILIVFFLLITALLPVLFPGPTHSINFRYATFPLLLFMSVILVSLGIFFLLNYRLFLLLEREDWPALAYYLEQKVFVKNRYYNRYVKLLASSYMVISDYPSVLKLENKVFLAKRSIVEKNALIFGSARVISGDYKGAAAFFKTHLDKGRLNKQDIEWVRWFHGFSWLLGKDFDKAESEFITIAVSSNDALLAGISAYFLANHLAGRSLRQQDCLVAAENGRKRVVDKLKNIENWKKEVNKTETDIHVAIIRKYVNEAGIWLFQEKEPVQYVPETDDVRNSSLDDLKDNESENKDLRYQDLKNKEPESL